MLCKRVWNKIFLATLDTSLYKVTQNISVGSALLFTGLGHYSKMLVFRDPETVLVLILHPCSKNKSFSWEDLPIIKFISQETYKYILMQPDNLYSRWLKKYMIHWIFAINCKQMAMNNYYKVNRTFSLITFTLIIHYFSYYFLLFLRME